MQITVSKQKIDVYSFKGHCKRAFVHMYISSRRKKLNLGTRITFDLCVKYVFVSLVFKLLLDM